MSTQHIPAALEWDLQDRLHKAMRYAGLTSGELGERLGVHRNTIANYLAGRTPVTRRTLLAWAVACGVPVVWLETGAAPHGPGGGGWAHRESNPEPAVSTLRLVA